MPNDRILVVDDEETIREIVSSMLGGAHFQTRQAASGIEALSILESGDEFDLVLSDLMMAEMDGIALLERAKERYPDMPIRHGHRRPRHSGRAAGAAQWGVRLPAQALRARATAGHSAPRPGESPPQARKRRLSHQPRGAGRERTQQWKTALSNLEKSYDITLEVLGDALDLKDAETEGHSRRVTAFTIAMRAKWACRKRDIKVIARGAFLHDIGKMAIPDAHPAQARQAHGDEMAIMKEHCYLGYKIISRIPFLAEAAEIVYAHQERYDGTGLSPWPEGRGDSAGRANFRHCRYARCHEIERPYRGPRPFRRFARKSNLVRPPVRSSDRQGFSRNARQYLGGPAEGHPWARPGSAEHGRHSRLLLSFDEIETRHGWIALIATVIGVPGDHGIKAPNSEGEIERKGPGAKQTVEDASADAAAGGTGAGGGAGAGAMAGVLASRDLRLEKGATLEVRLDRALQIPSH
jgi:putative nucleotidyltransferase with HDIG domain